MQGSDHRHVASGGGGDGGDADGTVLNGNGAPANNTGKNGDTYRDDETGAWYKKASDAWSAVLYTPTTISDLTGTTIIAGTDNIPFEDTSGGDENKISVRNLGGHFGGAGLRVNTTSGGLSLNLDELSSINTLGGTDRLHIGRSASDSKIALSEFTTHLAGNVLQSTDAGVINLAHDNTLQVDSSDQLGVNVSDVTEHLQESIRYFTDGDTFSTTPHATKGVVYSTSPFRKSISHLHMSWSNPLGHSLHLGLYRLDKTNGEILEVLFFGAAIIGDAGVDGHDLHFPDINQLNIPAGIDLGICFSRADGGTLPVNILHGAASADSPDASYGNAASDFTFRHNTLLNVSVPSVGQSLIAGAAGEPWGNIEIFYRVVIDHASLVGDGNVNIDHISSGSATDGQVITADGAGSAAWETPTGGSGGTTAASVYSELLTASVVAGSANVFQDVLADSVVPDDFEFLHFNGGRDDNAPLTNDFYPGQWHRLSKAQWDALIVAAVGATPISTTSLGYRDFIPNAATTATARDFKIGKNATGGMLISVSIIGRPLRQFKVIVEVAGSTSSGQESPGSGFGGDLIILYLRATDDTRPADPVDPYTNGDYVTDFGDWVDDIADLTGTGFDWVAVGGTAEDADGAIVNRTWALSAYIAVQYAEIVQDNNTYTNTASTDSRFVRHRLTDGTWGPWVPLSLTDWVPVLTDWNAYVTQTGSTQTISSGTLNFDATYFNEMRITVYTFGDFLASVPINRGIRGQAIITRWGSKWTELESSNATHGFGSYKLRLDDKQGLELVQLDWHGRVDLQGDQQNNDADEPNPRASCRMDMVGRFINGVYFPNTIGAITFRDHPSAWNRIRATVEMR